MTSNIRAPIISIRPGGKLIIVILLPSQPVLGKPLGYVDNNYTADKT
jgi:hypothetical protein